MCSRLSPAMHEACICQQSKTSSLQQSASATCTEAHGHGAKLICIASDAQLAVVVEPPAQGAAAARNSARVNSSRCNGGDGNACRGEVSVFDARAAQELQPGVYSSTGPSSFTHARVRTQTHTSHTQARAHTRKQMHESEPVVVQTRALTSSNY
jgi:hypothetical protein